MILILSVHMKNIKLYLETFGSCQVNKIDVDYILTRLCHQQAPARDFFAQILFLYQAL
jgi:hypothetical protein